MRRPVRCASPTSVSRLYRRQWPRFLVDGAVEGLERGHQQHDRATRHQHGCHGFERAVIVLDMFQHVQADARVRAPARQVGERAA